MTPPILIEPSMIAGDAGSLQIVHYPATRPAKRGVLCIPPFAEEMNRSRRMMALQAQDLARSGQGSAILDLYGCGDSAGDFRDARWEIWVRDVDRAVTWMRERGYREIALLGVRLGGLLALEAAKALGRDIARVVLWQPVLSGEQTISQFLRLRIAADLTKGSNRGGTTDLRRSLASEGTIEIAGYELHDGLAAAVEGLRLAKSGLGCPAPIDWIEIAPQQDRAPPAAHEQIARRWHEAKVSFTQHRVVGEPFWSLQETTIAPAVIARTSELLARSG